MGSATFIINGVKDTKNDKSKVWGRPPVCRFTESLTPCPSGRRNTGPEARLTGRPEVCPTLRPEQLRILKTRAGSAERQPSESGSRQPPEAPARETLLGESDEPANSLAAGLQSEMQICREGNKKHWDHPNRRTRCDGERTRLHRTPLSTILFENFRLFARTCVFKAFSSSSIALIRLGRSGRDTVKR